MLFFFLFLYLNQLGAYHQNMRSGKTENGGGEKTLCLEFGLVRLL